MKVKTAYRPKSEIPENISAENKPAAEAVIAAPEAPAVAAVEVRHDPTGPQAEAAREYEKRASEPDEAALALQRQIEELRKSEALLKQHAQHAAQVQQAPPTREQLLDQWRRQGVSDANLKFLEANPELVDGWQLTFHAANEATQHGHEPNTDAHREATKEIFHRYLAEAEKQAAQAQAPTEPAMQETPKFFAPPPAKPPRASASHYSAPPTREVPSGGPRPDYETGRTTLSPEEKEIARMSGVSLEAYAAGKIALARRKATGDVQ
jgi:hypothetical protein